MERYIYNLAIALEAVFANKFRSGLTALGIIFGVAAVITMLAIGNGAKQEILTQMKLVGVNNIIITPILETTDELKDDKALNEKKRFSPGLTLSDAISIQEVIPTVEQISPEIVYPTYVIRDGIRRKTDVIGVLPSFYKIFSLSIKEGEMFNKSQLENGEPVCIIGQLIKSTLFGKNNPLNKYIKCGNVWLKVIGVIEDRSVSEKATANLGINDYNNSVYAPLQTVLRRFIDRSVVTSSLIQQGGLQPIDGSNGGKPNNNQLDKIVVQVKETQYLTITSEIINRMLRRRHNDIEDYKVIIPELLLKQEQRTKDIFNLVLGAIASISLLVGGIGIMNIMLASVMERTKEIGVRLAVGATKKDVIFQFLAEATIISLTGGIIGIITGVILSKLIMQFTDILTIVSAFSIVISFGVSVSVGVIFGYMPARKAAQSDPVTSLRYE